MKKILNILYKITHSKDYYHNRNLWYLFKIKRSADGTISEIKFNGDIVPISKSELTDVKNKPLVLVASGPSINKIDKSFFNRDDMIFFGVNGAISISNANFFYYCIMDPGFVVGRIDLISKVLQNKSLILFCNFQTLHAIYTNIKKENILCSFKLIETIVKGVGLHFMGGRENITPGCQSDIFYWSDGFGFSSDINRFTFDYGTVSYVALQIACYMGYKKIFIAGLDMNNLNKPRFYESINNKQPTNLLKDFYNIKMAFNSSGEFCKANGIEVVNLSIGSEIESFEKKDYLNI